ncbi:MAG: hypothetical protein KDI05_11190 [Halieaceae bacterium]|nr:hypothetical protein [Halieaceae bacterium]MCP5202576.1 hypothetical protein [Pseudomonadales bacterium]
MTSFRITAVFAAAIGLAGAASAQEMRCGNALISGDQINPLLKEQVLEMCGQPTTQGFERWYYQEQGKILVFNGNGELDHIEDAGENVDPYVE